jgi:hypothetical protein
MEYTMMPRTLNPTKSPQARTKFRRTLTPIAATAFSVAMLSAIALPASAATSTGGAPAAANKSVSFDKSWSFKSKAIGACVTFRVTGKIVYSTVASGRAPGVVLWQNQQLKAPKLTANVRSYNGGSCIGPEALSKISMGQLWTGYSCSFNPSMSVSIPWGVSVGGWPSCGSRKRASHSSSYGPGGSYTQNNTGSPTKFGNFTGSTSHVPCYGVYVSSTAYNGNTSDSFGSAAREVCLPVK